MQILRQRPALRVIVSSATMDVGKLALFFANASHGHLPAPPPAGAAQQQHEAVPSGKPAVLSVQGRLYPVQEHFLKVPRLHTCTISFVWDIKPTCPLHVQ